MQKQSISLSIVLNEDLIFNYYMFLDGDYIDLNAAMDVLVDHNELSEHERCYRFLLDKISMNNQRFDVDTRVEKWGSIEGGYAVIYCQAFKELCNSGGFSDKAFLSWADKNDVIQVSGGRFTKLKKINGKPIRCVFLKLNEFEEEEEFYSVNEYDQEELPFT